MLKYVLAILFSMLPLVELRLGVPYAVGMGIDEPVAIVICAIGNLLPVPFIYFFARKLLIWGEKQKAIGKFCRFCLQKGEKAGQKLVKTAGRYGLFIALMLFVGIPLPGTGAWTGALGASFINMGFKSAVVSVTLGVLLAGCIMALASAGAFHMIGL